MKIAILSVLSTAAVTVNAQAGSEWSKEQFRSVFLTGVSFPTSAVGFICGGTDGVGQEVCRTDDAALTWPDVGMCGELADGAAFLLDVDFARGETDQGVMTGVGVLNTPLQYTEDSGATWESATTLYFGTTSSQDIDHVPSLFNNTVAATGSFGGTSGVALSINSGKLYTVIDWDFEYDGDNTAYARYGAFPSSDTWYVSGGNFPDSGEPLREDGLFRLSQHVTVDTSSGHAFVSETHSEKNDGYIGVIQKTTDGGETWNNIFLNDGGMYFNQIECPLVDTCWAVAEGSGDSQVFHTNDGGNTWEVQLELEDSLMSIKCVNERECWIGGGQIAVVNFRAALFYTKDAGQTWSRDTSSVWQDSYITNMDFIDSSHGFATAISRTGLSTDIFTYKPQSVSHH